MKTQRTIQTRRARPKSGFRMLHAATRFTKKRRQRAATSGAADDLREVPGVGVARALFVILLLHVAAIAGIYIHNRWSQSADIEATIPTLKENAPPTRLAELRPHVVSAGDNYDKIARKYGVDRELLVKVNEGKVLEPDWVINIPNRRAEEIRPLEVKVDRVSPPAYEPSYTHRARPLIQTSEMETYRGSTPGELVEVDGSLPEPTPRAILIKPRQPVVRQPVARQEPAPQPRPVATGRRHIVRAGETLWRIANNNGVSVNALQRANPNVNVSAMKIGTSLVIPAKR